MPYAQRQTVTVTTDAAGAATVYSRHFDGILRLLKYSKHGSTPFADGVDFAITVEATGQDILTRSDVNAGITVSPANRLERGDVYNNTSTDCPVVLAQDRVKIVITNGGNTKIGSFDIVVY